MFRQGSDETFCGTWERLKVMLRKCPNHGFEDIAQLNIFHNGLKTNTKRFLNTVGGVTMMVDEEKATQIIIKPIMIDILS